MKLCRYILLLFFKFTVPIVLSIFAYIYDSSMPEYIKLTALTLFIIDRFMSTCKDAIEKPKTSNVNIFEFIHIYYNNSSHGSNDVCPEFMWKLIALYDGIVGNAEMRIFCECKKNIVQNNIV